VDLNDKDGEEKNELEEVRLVGVAVVERLGVCATIDHSKNIKKALSKTIIRYQTSFFRR